jgi:hypothetical protein
MGDGMVRYAVIVVLLVFVSVLADRVAREENQRYALTLGMCRQPGALDLPSFECLGKVQTRTGWIWHLWYGIMDPLPQVSWQP